MQMPFLRHSEVGSTTIWLRMYWHTGAHDVNVHFSCAPFGYTCARICSVSGACAMHQEVCVAHRGEALCLCKERSLNRSWDYLVFGTTPADCTHSVRQLIMFRAHQVDSL